MIEHSYISKKVRVCASGINCRGVFAKQPLKKGEVITVFGGHIITQQEFNSLARKEFKNIHDYATKVADGFYLVSCKQGGLEDDDFFNHSCNPNTGLNGHLLMVAMRDIRAGEEITYDYAMTDADFNYSFRCSCGTAQCRDVIRTTDYKRKDLQRRYKGYFSWYVQSKINQQRKSIKK